MCCTFTRSKMSDTRLYAGEAEKDGKTVHVLAYQNTAQTDAPNAMVLPIPTWEGLTSSNLIDTRPFKNFLKDITEASKIQTRSLGKSRRAMYLGDSAEVVEVGSYTVVLAEHVDQIQEALTRVPTHKRPAVSESFINGYAKLYPNDPIVVCCWDGSIEAEPLLMWYQPKDRSTLFIPTMDAHDGDAPVVGEKVLTDAIVSVGAIGAEYGYGVRYTDTIPRDVKSLLPVQVCSHRLPTWLENGDVFVETGALVREADPELIRGFGDKIFMRASMHGWH